MNVYLYIKMLLRKDFEATIIFLPQPHEVGGLGFLASAVCYADGAGCGDALVFQLYLVVVLLAHLKVYVAAHLFLHLCHELCGLLIAGCFGVYLCQHGAYLLGCHLVLSGCPDGFGAVQQVEVHAVEVLCV